MMRIACILGLYYDWDRCRHTIGTYVFSLFSFFTVQGAPCFRLRGNGKLLMVLLASRTS